MLVRLAIYVLPHSALNPVFIIVTKEELSLRGVGVPRTKEETKDKIRTDDVKSLI